jgi:hypothetical protein
MCEVRCAARPAMLALILFSLRRKDPWAKRTMPLPNQARLVLVLSVACQTTGSTGLSRRRLSATWQGERQISTRLLPERFVQRTSCPAYGDYKYTCGAADRETPQVHRPRRPWLIVISCVGSSWSRRSEAMMPRRTETIRNA